MNIVTFVNEIKLTIINDAIGTMLGFLFWKFICGASGRCLITLDH